MKCTGNGNCLFNAVSILTSGDESNAAVLRSKTAKELKTRSTAYGKHRFLLAASKEMGTDVPTLLQSILSPNTASMDATNVPICIENEAIATEDPGHWSSVMQVLALSNVVNRPSTTILNSEDHYAKALLHGPVYPLNFLAANKKPLVLLWSNSSITKSLSPDHIVPLTQ